ncbi:MAG: alkaline phosphatase family protein [Candidatus Limnocylindrales bacterium]|jgi:acid phosphatase
MARVTASRLASIAIAAAFAAAACGNATPTPSTSPTPATPPPSASPTASPTASPAPSTTPIPTPIPTPSPIEGIPAFKHVYVIIMENKEYGSIVGARAAPYENSLIARYGLATSFYAETHPSEPNYIALTSGDLNGTHSDGYYNLHVANVFDQIEAAGRTWHVYAQGYPGHCYTGTIAAAVADGPGAPGQYVRKHNPAISYSSIESNKTRCANITHLAGFDPAAADFELIIPNQINDMHSSSVAAGDAFLKVFVPRITGSAAFVDSVLFITWDEGGTNRQGGGHIATIVVSPGMTPASRYAGAATHYSMLRTIEDAWRMPYLGKAAQTAPLVFPYQTGQDASGASS